MADQKPKRRIRKVETVREQAEKSAVTKPRKVRKIRATAAKAAAPIGAATRFGAREYNVIKLPDNKLGSFLGKKRRIFPRFFIEAWQELKQVTWPSRKETVKLTAAVLIFAIVFGAMVAAVDYGLDKLFRNVILG